MTLEYTEKEQEKVENYCKKNSISEGDLKKQIAKKYDELVETDQLLVKDDPEQTHAHRMARAIRAGQGYFRKYIRATSKGLPGMIICRHRNIGFDQFQLNRAKQKVDELGISQAIEEGYVNEKGDYLYSSGMNKGKVIPKKIESFTSATGFVISKDSKGNEYYDLRCFSIGEKLIHSMIPVGQYSKLAFNEGKEPKKGYPHSDSKVLFYNGGMVDANVPSPYGMEDFVKIVQIWNDIIPDMHFCNNFAELLDYRDEYCQDLKDKENEHYYDFCIVPGLCAEIRIDDDDIDKDYINRGVYITIVDPETYEMHDINVFVSRDEMQGLNIEEGMQGLFVLQSYRNGEEGRVNWHLGGFLPVDDTIDLEAFLNGLGEEGE